MKRHMLLCAVFAVAVPSVFAQGGLTPPGAPAPTMKTLEQIEPRIDVATLPGDAASEIVITNAGAYYLSANLEVAKTHGITIGGADVTLNLNGFGISRISGSGGDGIRIEGGMDRATVRNGVVSGFDHGIECESSPVFARGCLFEKLSVSGCASGGMHAGEAPRVLDCCAHDNQSSGIRAGATASISGCTAYCNQGTGIEAGVNSVVVDSSAMGNWWSGISVGVGSTVSRCSARENGEGILGGTGCTIRDCTAHYNYYGISVPNDCYILNNNCFDNGSHGISVGLDRNRVEGNNLTENNGYGISVDYSGNIVIRNSARGNGLGNYSIIPSNTVGQILDYGAGGVVTNANPWANFSF